MSPTTTGSDARAADCDAIVIGGGPAGLSAALYLGRARRRALVVDTGRPRNMKAEVSHGVFTRDGTPPGELLDQARRQLGTYPTIAFRRIAAVAASVAGTGFHVQLEDGEDIRTKRLILACGLRDDLPAIEGLEENWGGRVFNCTYCHGFEVADRPLAMLARGGAALQSVASMLQLSRDLVVLTHGPSEFPAAERQRIEDLGVQIREAEVLSVKDDPEGLVVRLADGSAIVRSALLVKGTPRLASDLPVQLGCRLSDSGGVVVDASWQTSVPGVYAAGDIAIQRKSVAMAAASGVEAAVCVDVALIREEYGI